MLWVGVASFLAGYYFCMYMRKKEIKKLLETIDLCIQYIKQLESRNILLGRAAQAKIAIMLDDMGYENPEKKDKPVS